MTALTHTHLRTQTRHRDRDNCQVHSSDILPKSKKVIRDLFLCEPLSPPHCTCQSFHCIFRASKFTMSVHVLVHLCLNDERALLHVWLHA